MAVKPITNKYPKSGKVAPINEKSTVVYKLVKPYIQPTTQNIIKPEPNPQEQALYQLKKKLVIIDFWKDDLN